MNNNNNISKHIVKEVAESNGWVKDGVKNVVTVSGEKWSVSVRTTEKIECRQVYENCVGFISIDCETKHPTFYRIDNLKDYAVSRISPDGTKAYNVIKKE